MQPVEDPVRQPVVVRQYVPEVGGQVGGRAVEPTSWVLDPAGDVEVGVRCAGRVVGDDGLVEGRRVERCVDHV